MTSQNELNLIKTNDTNENKQESSVSINPSPIEQPIIPKIEEEQINIEKPKRVGRKKRDITSITDIKTENLNNDNAMDTQPLFEQPIILEGKRSRKPTSRLELSELSTPKKELSIPQGHGKPLGEIEYINYQITHASTDALSRMRNICFGRRASKVNIRKNLRDFNGFEFERNSDEYEKHLNNLIKLKKDQLKSISDILGLSSTGRNNEHAERILNFLMEPIDEGKTIPERKLSMRTSTKSSTNSKESLHTDEEENEIEEKTENGGDNNDDDDEIFDVEEEEEEEKEAETDDDYIGSDDEESGLHIKDDPDDFVYQPGKKIPKKRTSFKRSRSGSTRRKKRGVSTTSKRGRKRTKIIVDEKIEKTIPDETNDEEINPIETKNDDLNTKSNDPITNNPVIDIIPTTS